MTLLRTLAGFAFAFLIALVLGILAGSFPKFKVFLTPLVTVLKSAPTAAFVFILLVISKSSIAPIYIVILLSFPILYESIIGGINSISEEINDSLKVDSGNFFYSLFRVKLPLSLPYVVVGLASSFALSLKTEIMAEIITANTSYGLGSAITASRIKDPSDLSPIFAIAFIAISIILIVDIVGIVIKNKYEK